MKGKKLLVVSLLSLATVVCLGGESRRLPVTLSGFVTYHQNPPPSVLVGGVTLQRGGAALTDWSARLNNAYDMRPMTGRYVGQIDAYSVAVGNEVKIEVWEPVAERTSGTTLRTSPLITFRGRIPTLLRILSPASGEIVSLSRTRAITVRWHVTGSAAKTDLSIWEDLEDGRHRSVRYAYDQPGDSYTFETNILLPDRNYVIHFIQNLKSFGTLTGPVTPESRIEYTAAHSVSIHTVR